MANVSKSWKGAVRWARDFSFGLILFWGVTIGLCATNTPANAFHLPNAPAISDETGAARLLKTEKASYYTTVAMGPLRELNTTQVQARPTILMLGFVFAFITMLNLAFVRHVRRVAKPRRARAVGSPRR